MNDEGAPEVGALDKCGSCGGAELPAEEITMIEAEVVPMYEDDRVRIGKEHSCVER